MFSGFSFHSPNTRKCTFFLFYFILTTLTSWQVLQTISLSCIEHSQKGRCTRDFVKDGRACAVDNYWVQVLHRDICDKRHTLKINFNWYTDVENQIICSCLNWLISLQNTVSFEMFFWRLLYFCFLVQQWNLWLWEKQYGKNMFNLWISDRLWKFTLFSLDLSKTAILSLLFLQKTGLSHLCLEKEMKIRRGGSEREYKSQVKWLFKNYCNEVMRTRGKKKTTIV